MSDLGFGAGGVSEALQLVQALQTGKVENQQRQIGLEKSQLELDNTKKLQAALAGGQFSGLSSSDPDEQTKSMHDLANTYLANNQPEAAKNISSMANDIAKTKVEVASKQASTALEYADTASKVFAGVTTAEEWHAAQTYMQSVLPPDALKNPAVKGLLTSPFDPAKVAVLPEFLERVKARAQAALEAANTARANSETRTQAFDQKLKEAETLDHEAHAKYLKKMGGDADELGDPAGDWQSKFRYLLSKEQIPLPLGTRSMAARTQFMADAQKNNAGRTPEEVVADMKAGLIGIKGELTEAGVVARREGNIATAQTALVQPGGVYDQLAEAAGKVDFGSSKVKNAIRKGLQEHIYASPEIQAYVTKLEDARAELGTVLSRSGQLTDVARAQAAHALPDTASLGEIKAAIQASREVGSAVMNSNTLVMKALKEGKPIEEVLKAMQSAGAPKVFASEAAANAAAKAGKLNKGDKIVIGGQKGTWQ